MQSMEARPPPPTATALLGRAGATLATAALSVLLPLSSPLPATAAATVAATIPPRHTTTTFLANTAVAAANLPEDVLAAALVSLGKGASLDRITAPAAEGQPPSSPALYVTARVGARGRVLASLRVPLVRSASCFFNRRTVFVHIITQHPPTNPHIPNPPQADLPNGGFPAEVAVRTADIYADTPEAKEEVARSIRRRDLLLSARLDRGG